MSGENSIEIVKDLVKVVEESMEVVEGSMKEIEPLWKQELVRSMMKILPPKFC